MRFHNLLARHRPRRHRDPLDAHRRRRRRPLPAIRGDQQGPRAARGRAARGGGAAPRQASGSASVDRARSSMALATLPVISTRLRRADTRPCAHAPMPRPAPGFETVEPELEDVYFSAVARPPRAGARGGGLTMECSLAIAAFELRSARGASRPTSTSSCSPRSPRCGWRPRAAPSRSAAVDIRHRQGAHQLAVCARAD